MSQPPNIDDLVNKFCLSWSEYHLNPKYVEQIQVRDKTTWPKEVQEARELLVILVSKAAEFVEEQLNDGQFHN